MCAVFAFPQGCDLNVAQWTASLSKASRNSSAHAPPVEGLSFEVRPGEVFGLLGPNGAGKTTTVRMLAGLLTQSRGTAIVCGHRLEEQPTRFAKTSRFHRAARPLRNGGRALFAITFVFICAYMSSMKTSGPSIHHDSNACPLGREHERPGGSLSKGMRQKVAIIRAVLHAPKILFLDEPTSGLDPEAAKTVQIIAENWPPKAGARRLLAQPRRSRAPVCPCCGDRRIDCSPSRRSRHFEKTACSSKYGSPKTPTRTLRHSPPEKPKPTTSAFGSPWAQKMKCRKYFGEAG